MNESYTLHGAGLSDAENESEGDGHTDSEGDGDGEQHGLHFAGRPISTAIYPQWAPFLSQRLETDDVYTRRSGEIHGTIRHDVLLVRQRDASCFGNEPSEVRSPRPGETVRGGLKIGRELPVDYRLVWRNLQVHRGRADAESPADDAHLQEHVDHVNHSVPLCVRRQFAFASVLQKTAHEPPRTFSGTGSPSESPTASVLNRKLRSTFRYSAELSVLETTRWYSGSDAPGSSRRK